MVRIQLACNGDGGVFAGAVEAIAVRAGDQGLDLEPSRCAPPRLTIAENDSPYHGGRLRVFRRWFSFSASADWVGNWCWNEYVMSVDDAARLLRAALAKGFSITEADGNDACALSNICDKQEKIVAEATVREHLGKMVSPR